MTENLQSIQIKSFIAQPLRMVQFCTCVTELYWSLCESVYVRVQIRHLKRFSQVTQTCKRPSQETSHETSSKTAGGLVIWPQESFIRMYSRTMGGVIECICIYVYLLTYWELLEYMKETQFPPDGRDGEHFIGLNFVLFNIMMRFGFEPHLQ